MKAIHVIKCRDSLLWYSNQVGNIVPLLREESDIFMSVEPGGYSNIIYKEDAIITEIESTNVDWYTKYLEVHYG